VEAYGFMKGEPDILQLYEGRYNAALQGVQKIGQYDDQRDWYRNGARASA